MSRLSLQEQLTMQIGTTPQHLFPTLARPCRIEKLNFVEGMPKNEKGRKYTVSRARSNVKYSGSNPKPSMAKQVMKLEAASFRDLVLAGALGVQGNVLPTADGALWKYVFNLMGEEIADLPELLSVEAGNNVEKLTSQYQYVESMTLEGVVGSGEITVTFNGRGDKATAFTAFTDTETYDEGDPVIFGQSLPTLTVDDAHGDIGTTELPQCKFTGFKIELNWGTESKETVCGFQHALGDCEVKASYFFLIDEDVYGEYSKWLADAKRFVQLTVPAVGATGEQLVIKHAGYWETASPGADGKFRKLELMLMPELDDDLGYDFQMEVTTDMAFPEWRYPIFYDSFTDTDGTLLTAHTPDYNPNGQDWGGSGSINDGQASGTASVVPLGQTDCLMYAHVIPGTGTASLYGRYDSISDNVMLSVTSASITLKKNVSGVATTISTVALGGSGVVAILFQGESVSVSFDGALLFEATVSESVAYSKFGMTASGNAKVDNLGVM